MEYEEMIKKTIKDAARKDLHTAYDYVRINELIWMENSMRGFFVIYNFAVETTIRDALGMKNKVTVFIEYNAMNREIEKIRWDY